MSETPNKLPASARPILILLSLLVLALAVWTVFGDRLSQLAAHSSPLTEPPSPIPALQAQLDEADAKIKALEDAAAAPKPPSDEDAKIAALQARLEALIKQPQAAPDAHLAALIVAQQQALQALSAKLNAVIALMEIKDAVQSGQPFAEPLVALKQAMTGEASTQPLITLALYANKPMPTLTELQNGFEAAIPAALSSGDHGAMHLLKDFVSIRRVGEVSGHGDDAIIARAEARLKDGDIEKAVNEAASLPPDAASAFAPWLAKAKALLAVHHAIAALEQALLKDTK